MVEQPIEVDVQIAGEDLHAGRLWTHSHGQSESATFSYREDYLQRADAYELDPGLSLQAGQHQTALGHALFGAMSDCAPDGWGRRTLNNLGQLLLATDPSAAIDLHQRALDIRSKLNDRHGVARTSGLLATALATVGRIAEAHQLLTDALEIRQELGDRYGEAETNLQEAGIALVASDLDTARTHAERALSIADDLQVSMQAAQALRILAIVEAQSGQTVRSAQFLGRAIEILRGSGLEAEALKVEQERPEPMS